MVSGIMANDAIHDTLSPEPSEVELEVVEFHPDEYQQKHRKYLRKQEAAKTYVFSRLTLPIIDSVRRCITVRQILETLDDEYRMQSQAVESMARRKFYSMRYVDFNDMHEFLAKYQHYADQLLDAGVYLSTREKVQQLKLALPREYEVTIMEYNLYAKDHGMSFNVLKRMLLDSYERDIEDRKLENLYSHTRRLNIENDKDSSGRRSGATVIKTPKQPAPSADTSSRDRRESAPRNAKPDSTPSRTDFVTPITCYGCGGHGHRKSECPSRLKADTETTKQQEPKSNPPVAAESTSRASEERPSRTYEERRAKAHALMVQRRSENTLPNRPATLDDVFMLDTGAFGHLSADLDSLNRVVRLPEPIEIITAAQDAPLKATHRGEMLIEVLGRDGVVETLLLSEVFHVPGLQMNLLSENKITESGVNVIQFSKEHADVLNTETKKILFSATRVGSAKYVHFRAILADKSATTHACPAASQIPTDLTQTISRPPTTSTEKWRWHRRLGHLSGKYLRRLELQSPTFPKLNFGATDFLSCTVCAQAKSTRAGHNTVRHEAVRLFEIVSTDILGPFTTGIMGEKFVATFIDNFSHFVYIALMKNKSDVAAAFAKYHKATEAKFPGSPLHILRADCAREYVDGDFRAYCEAAGVTIEETVAHSPELNGVAERMNRTIEERMRALLFDAALPMQYWPWAIKAAVYLINRSPSRTNPEYKTPFEIWYDRPPNYTNLRIFGCLAYRHVPEAVRNQTTSKQRRRGETADAKLCPRAEKKILIGYTATGYSVLDPTTNKTLPTCDVRFDESRNLETIAEDPERDVSSSPPPSDAPNPAPIASSPPSSTSDQAPLPTTPSFPAIEPARILNDHSYAAYSVLVDPPRKQNRLLEECVPTAYRDIPNNPFAAQWYKSVRTELQVMEKNQVFETVRLPQHAKPIDSKWVFTIKYTEDGEPYAKSRLVARGFRDPTDYRVGDIYSPVVHQWLIRWTLAMANKHQMSLTKFDVEAAFLHADLKQRIYLSIPEGMSSSSSNTVLQLHKSIYGLKPSCKNWYNLLGDALLAAGLTKSRADRCLYYAKFPDGTMAIVLVYVDDILLATSNLTFVSTLTAALKHEFHIKMVENPTSFVGFQIRRDELTRSIFVHQSTYIQRILLRFCMLDSHPQSTPMETGLRLDRTTEGKDDREYRAMIGALLYLARGTRPDISFAVNMLSRLQASSTDVDKSHVRRIFRYLKGTSHYELKFTSMGKSVECYVDASYAPDVCVSSSVLDLSLGKSVTGYLVRFFDDPVIWNVKKQTIAASSSTAAEVIAIHDALDDLQVAHYIMDELFNEKMPVKVWEDNTSAQKIVMAGDPKKNRALLIKCYAVLDAVADKEIDVLTVPSSGQLADALTKALDKEKLHKFVREIFLIDRNE